MHKHTFTPITINIDTLIHAGIHEVEVEAEETILAPNYYAPVYTMK